MREIVVGVDGSLAAARAADRALDLAAKSGRPIRLVYAYSGPVWPGQPRGMADFPEPDQNTDERYARRHLEELLAKGLGRRGSEGPMRVSGEVTHGDAGRALVHEAKNAAVVVVGGPGRGLAQSAILGSSTAYVLHHAPCPVMVVPASEQPPPAIERVVVGVDGSGGSRSALRWAMDAARREDVDLVAAYGYVTHSLPARPRSRQALGHEEYEQVAREELDRELADTIPSDAAVSVRGRLLHDTPVPGLLSLAGPRDLLVVGSRGRGGFASLLVGSVATQCVQHASGTVVVVREDLERLDS